MWTLPAAIVMLIFIGILAILIGNDTRVEEKLEKKDEPAPVPGPKPEPEKEPVHIEQ